MRVLILFITMFWSALLHGQFIQNSKSIKATQHFPAMYDYEQGRIEIAYHNQYSLPELAFKSIAFNKSFSFIHYQFQFETMGSAYFKYYLLHHNVLTKLSDAVDFGIGLSQHQQWLKHADFKNPLYWHPKIHLKIQLSEDFFITQSSMALENFKRFQNNLLLAYQTEDFALQTWLIVKSNYWNYGLEFFYALNSNIELNAAFNNRYAPFAFGVNTKYKSLYLCLNFAYHLQLGRSDFLIASWEYAKN